MQTSGHAFCHLKDMDGSFPPHWTWKFQNGWWLNHEISALIVAHTLLVLLCFQKNQFLMTIQQCPSWFWWWIILDSKFVMKFTRNSILVLVDTACSRCFSFPFVSTVTFSKCIKYTQTELSDCVSKSYLISSQMERILEHVDFLSGVHNQLI